MACAETPPEEARRRLDEIRLEGERTNQAMDALEDRLLADQANVRLWQEMQRRHQHVSALAIVNQGDHFTQMVQQLHEQEEKARRLKRRGHVAEGPGPWPGEAAYYARMPSSHTDRGY